MLWWMQAAVYSLDFPAVIQRSEHCSCVHLVLQFCSGEKKRANTMFGPRFTRLISALQHCSTAHSLHTANSTPE